MLCFRVHQITFNISLFPLKLIFIHIILTQTSNLSYFYQYILIGLMHLIMTMLFYESQLDCALVAFNIIRVLLKY